MAEVQLDLKVNSAQAAKDMDTFVKSAKDLKVDRSVAIDDGVPELGKGPDKGGKPRLSSDIDKSISGLEQPLKDIARMARSIEKLVKQQYTKQDEESVDRPPAPTPKEPSDDGSIFSGLGVDKSLADTLSKLSSGIGGMIGQLGGLGKLAPALGGILAGVKAIQGISKFVQQGQEYNADIRDAAWGTFGRTDRSYINRSWGEDTVAITEYARGIGYEAGYSAPESIQAQDYFQRAGGNAEGMTANNQTDMRTVAEMSRMLGLDLNTAAGFAGSSMRTGVIQSGEVNKLANMFTTSMKELNMIGQEDKLVELMSDIRDELAKNLGGMVTSEQLMNYMSAAGTIQDQTGMSGQAALTAAGELDAAIKSMSSFWFGYGATDKDYGIEVNAYGEEEMMMRRAAGLADPDTRKSLFGQAGELGMLHTRDEIDAMRQTDKQTADDWQTMRIAFFRQMAAMGMDEATTAKFIDSGVAEKFRTGDYTDEEMKSWTEPGGPLEGMGDFSSTFMSAEAKAEQNWSNMQGAVGSIADNILLLKNHFINDVLDPGGIESYTPIRPKDEFGYGYDPENQTVTEQKVFDTEWGAVSQKLTRPATDAEKIQYDQYMLSEDKKRQDREERLKNDTAYSYNAENPLDVKSDSSQVNRQIAERNKVESYKQRDIPDVEGTAADNSTSRVELTVKLEGGVQGFSIGENQGVVDAIAKAFSAPHGGILGGLAKAMTRKVN